MTIEPQRQGAEQPQPFSERPQQPPGGCSRPVLIGCAAAVVLLGLLLLGVLWKARDLMPALFRWSLGQFEQQVTGNLPENLGEGERQRLAAAFDAAAAAVEDGTADAAALQRLQGRLLDVARSRRLTRDQVLDLVEALEAVAGERAPPAQPEPPPAGETPMPQAALAASAGRPPGAAGRLIVDRFELVVRVRPAGRSAGRDPPAGGRGRRRAARPGAARRHRLGQDLHHRQRRSRRVQPADAGPGAQQDAGRPALPGVPAASSRTTPSSTSSPTTTTTSPRPTSRSRTPTSRRTRRSTRRSTACATAATRVAVRAARRADRRQRLLHLRPRLARGLLRHAAVPRARATQVDRDAAAAQAGRDPVRAHRLDLRRGHLPRARRRGRDLPGLRGATALRIEFFGDEIERARARSTRCAARSLERLDRRRGLPHDPLRDAARAHAAGDRRRSAASSRSAWRSSRPRASCSRRQRLRAAHALRPRDAARDRLLPRHRELLAPPRPAAAPASRRRRCSTTSPTTACWSSTRATQTRAPGRAACTTATARARRPWSSTASACPARSTTGR